MFFGLLRYIWTLLSLVRMNLRPTTHFTISSRKYLLVFQVLDIMGFDTHSWLSEADTQQVTEIQGQLLLGLQFLQFLSNLNLPTGSVPLSVRKKLIVWRTAEVLYPRGGLLVPIWCLYTALCVYTHRPDLCPDRTTRKEYGNGHHLLSEDYWILPLYLGSCQRENWVCFMGHGWV